MVNQGVAPPDPTSDVGKFRFLYGDTAYVALTPPETGYGDYAELSDAEIEAFLAAGSGSVTRAIGVYYMQLSGQAAKVAESVKDHDLSIDETKRAGDLRQTAMMWFSRADDDDLGLSDAFEVVGVGQSCEIVPELSLPEFGRVYIWGRVC